MIFLEILLFLLGAAFLAWGYGVSRQHMYQLLPPFLNKKADGHAAADEIARQMMLVGGGYLLAFLFSLFMDHFFTCIWFILVLLATLGLAGYQIYQLLWGK